MKFRRCKRHSRSNISAMKSLCLRTKYNLTLKRINNNNSNDEKRMYDSVKFNILDKISRRFLDINLLPLDSCLTYPIFDM